MIFLKLGGSLITEKATPSTPRSAVIQRLSQEISEALKGAGGIPLLLGHGSGSFGHPVADRYQTAHGAERPDQWQGFAEVWAAANQLNRIVIDSLLGAGLPVISLPPSTSTVCAGGEIAAMSVEPIERAIAAGLVPVIQGDVAFDRVLGATILSTEKVFRFLATQLQPTMVLLAGSEGGVYQDFTTKDAVLPEITPADLDQLALGASTDVDVTGGMLDKVLEALEISRSVPGCSVRIFSGFEPGVVLKALHGAPVGTLVRTSP